MAIDDDGEAFLAMRARLADLLPRLNERDRRLAMAAEAKSLGRGGISAVERATGASRSTIRRGMAELAEDQPEPPSERVRDPGGGRKKAEVADPELLDALDRLIEPETRGDPESPLRWTKSPGHQPLSAALLPHRAHLQHRWISLRRRVQLTLLRMERDSGGRPDSHCHTCDHGGNCWGHCRRNLYGLVAGGARRIGAAGCSDVGQIIL